MSEQPKCPGCGLSVKKTVGSTTVWWCGSWVDSVDKLRAMGRERDELNQALAVTCYGKPRYQMSGPNAEWRAWEKEKKRLTVRVAEVECSLDEFIAAIAKESKDAHNTES